ncbi:MAG: TatD family hydrolase [Uliginosibacterium sp.]|nr:TatD family hydrolase [Uliginosibacterium sp.]
MLIDTHLHLDASEFDADRQSVVADARAAGVERFVLPAVSLESCVALTRLAHAVPGAVVACGIHPLYVNGRPDTDIVALRQHLSAGVVAVGEIGLDGFVADADPVRQSWFFCEQLKLAREFDLPVLLHVRRAQDQVLKYLRRYGIRSGIAHAFNGSLQQAQAFIDMGFVLGFGGAMTYAGSSRIRRLAAELPIESIVLESDAPDIPPSWAPASRNVPANVARFATELAMLRGLTPTEIAAATTANACRVLRMPV